MIRPVHPQPPLVAGRFAGRARDDWQRQTRGAIRRRHPHREPGHRHNGHRRGFAEATIQHSRSQLEELLDSHHRILLPLVRRFKGRHVKSMEDALLLVFRSPTDAVLCAMAMQDALYEYNRTVPKERQIHLRIGASLGEVRVARNDVFGEPVNLTRRIADLAPADEIYLSEALFMAMNKAEVPV